MMSLDERERRAQERMMCLPQGCLPGDATDANGNRRPRTNRSDLSARSTEREDVNYGVGPPRPGDGSLYENYVNLQDPWKFSTDEEEVEELMRLGVGWTQHSEADERYLEANWDPSPHKNPPAYLKEIKPFTREPWTIDQEVYNRAFNQSDFGKPQRYGVDLFNMGTPVHEDGVGDPRKRPKGAKNGWNSSTFKEVPYALRGLKPSTTSTEPWVKDLSTRRAYGDFENTNLIEDDTLISLDNGGEQRFKKGAFRAYKEERNRKLHAEPWDNSTRTW